VSLVFLAGTVLATLGLGEHYLIDLVVALAFTLAVHTACTPRRDRYATPRARALVASIGLTALWYAVLFRGTSLLHSWPVLTWGLSLATLGVVVALERDLYWTVDGSMAPGPRTWWPMGHLLSFRRDPLTLLAAARDRYGDVVRFRLGWQPVHLIAHPDHVRHVLVTNQRNYDKDTRSSAKIRGVIGESLLTANGDAWLTERRLMQPVFKPRSVEALAGVMTDATTAMLAGWESHAATGGPLDIASEMMRVTYTIVGKALFGADVTRDIDAVAVAATRVMTHTYRQVEWLVNTPEWLPTRGNLAFRRAVAELDTLVYRIIDDRQLRKGTDIASLLLRGADEEQSGTMTRQEPRQCIGSHFALMEAQLIVAMVAQRFRLDLATDARVVPSPGITLRCRDGLPMVLRAVGVPAAP
jgi:cytochrome P450